MRIHSGVIFMPGLSIIVPALNEEKNLFRTIQIIEDSLCPPFETFEIIIIDDGSRDATKDKAEFLVKNRPAIQLIHNKKSLGRGAAIKQGLKRAKNDYAIVVNGKADTTAYELKKILACAGQADLVISIQSNTHQRPLIRRFFSKLYTKIMNKSFNLNLNYYNGSTLWPRRLYKNFCLKGNSYALEAEILIPLLKSGHSYHQVPVEDQFERGRKTRAFNLKNIFSVIRFYLQMLWTVHFVGLKKSKC